MAKLNIPKNYLNLTLDELIKTMLGPSNVVVLESFKIQKANDYKKVIDSINSIMGEDYSIQLLGTSEDEKEDNRWTLELEIGATTLEATLQQEEDKIEDRALTNAINQLLSQIGAKFQVFSYWDSEWDSHSVGWAKIPTKSIPQLKEIIQARKDNDWFELFYLS